MEQITTVSAIPEGGSYLFTARDPDGREEEVILLCLDGDVRAWKNFCMHETDQRLDRGMGAAVRDGGIICPRHGSIFDGRTGYCDNGKAKGSTLAEVDVTVRRGTVYLTDDDLEFAHDGGIDDHDLPDSTSHIGF